MGKPHSLDSGSSNRLLSTFPWVFPSSASVVDSQAGPFLAMEVFGRGIAAGTCLTPASGCARSLSSVALVLDVPKITHKKCLAETPVSPRGAIKRQAVQDVRGGHLENAMGT